MTFFNWFRLRNALVLSTTLALVSINILDLEANPLKKRRKGGGSGSDLEVFQNNYEIFFGPSASIASGDFTSSSLSFLKSNNETYKYSSDDNKIRLTYQFGASFRMVPQPRADHFMRYLSFSAGFMYQRLGYNQDITLITVKEGNYVDRIDFKEKYRSNYLSMPILVRVGRRLFGEIGLTANVLMGGTMDRVMERGDLYATDTTASSNYLTFANTSYNTAKVQPKISLGYCLGMGFMFNEHFGCRFFVNTNNRYFISDPNLGHTQYSFQLIGSIN